MLPAIKMHGLYSFPEMLVYPGGYEIVNALSQKKPRNNQGKNNSQGCQLNLSLGN